MHRITISEIRGIGFYLVEKDEYGNYIEENFLDYSTFFDKWKKRIEAQDNVVDFSIDENTIHIEAVEFQNFGFKVEEYLLTPSKEMLKSKETLEQFSKLAERFGLLKEQTLENIELRKQSYFSAEATKYIAEGVLNKYIKGEDIGFLSPDIRESVIKYFNDNKNSLCQYYFKVMLQVFKPFIGGSIVLLLAAIIFLSSIGVTIPSVIAGTLLVGGSAGAVFYNFANKRKDMAEGLRIFLKEESDRQNYRGSALENLEFNNMLLSSIKRDRELLSDTLDSEGILRELDILEKAIEGSEQVSKKMLLNMLASIETKIFSREATPHFVTDKSLHLTRRMVVERLNFLGLEEVKDEYQMRALFSVVDRVYKLPYSGAEVEIARLLIVASEYLDTREKNRRADMTFLAGIYDIEKQISKKINTIIDSEESDNQIIRVDEVKSEKKVSL